MDLKQDLMKVIRAKEGSDTAVMNQRFLNMFNTIEVMRGRSLLEEADVEPKVLLSYQDTSIKRRAQTIGDAYRTAFKMLLAITLNRGDLIVDMFSKRQYNSNKGYLDEVFKDSENSFIIDFHNNALFRLALLITDEPQINENLIQGLADISVTFTWVDKYYETTFMPKDTSIINTESDTHKKLVREVEYLLNNSKELIEIIRDLSLDGKKLWFRENIENDTLGIAGTANIVAGTKIIEVRTTETYPTDKKFLSGVRNIVGLTVLNESRDEPHLLDTGGLVYYIRFKELLEVVVLNG